MAISDPSTTHGVCDLKRLCQIMFIALMFGGSVPAYGKLYRYSTQSLAFAPNAGGQSAFSLRRSSESSEWSLFVNQYLISGPLPLIGVSYNSRHPMTRRSWPLQFALLLGGGLASSGPFLEVGWEFLALYALRVDIRTQATFYRTRILTWSYPIWFGVSLPLWF
jgi:hypothetical protein